MFSRIPFLLFAGCLTCGIITAPYVIPWLTSGCAMAVTLAISGAVLGGGRAGRFRGRLFAAGIPVSFFALGLTAALQQEERLSGFPDPEVTLPGYDVFLATVASLPERRGEGYRFEADVEALGGKGRWRDCPPLRCLLSFPDAGSQVPGPGERLLVRGRLERPRTPRNPGEFDYALFLKRKGIARTARITKGAFRILPGQGSTHGFDPVWWSYRVSVYADEVFRNRLADADAYGLVKAMILGRRDDLRQEVTDAYVTSGTVHILSVSGLHMSIFFLVISRLFGFLKRWKGGTYLYLAVLTAFISFYSLMTGLPASVMRAAVMCILWLVAEVSGRRSGLANTLLISGFLILIFDPVSIYDIGFQLSYLAMAGIIMFAEPFERIFSADRPLLHRIWSVTAVSFAAQLTTFPVSVYYFHQFPAYFWLINPLVIDISAVLLPLSFFLPVIDFLSWPAVADFAGWITGMLAGLTNWLVGMPRYLPGYLWEGIALDLPACCCCTRAAERCSR